GDKQAFLREAAQIPGVYVPSLYDIEYNDDKTIKAIVPKDNAPKVIQKRIIKDMDKVHYPDKFVMPYIEIVHDRAVQEIFRGCIRGCRFCQAGFIYRPVREKSPEVINAQAKALCDNTGYDEISLSSLSTSDYSKLEPLLNDMLDWSQKDNVSLSLPSLRVDNFSKELLEKINHVRKSGLTFAPEAGTQRLRDVINKNVTEEEIMRTCRMAFEGGYTSVKLYFMLGLPTETDEDLQGIAELGQKIVNEFYSMPNKPKGKSVNVSISVSTFVPKPFTPFQFEPQINIDEMRRRQSVVRDSVTTRKVSVSWHESKVSFLEGIFARGDRRLGCVIETALKKGCRFDGWDECFNLDKWLEAFDECGIDPDFFANRRREFNEILPWEHLDYGVSKEFLINENKTAHTAVTTPNCREKCSNCGAACFKGGVCFEKR
ncbi:MAG: TIGR03960 family B12-binding radical SAM protein, partial [Clostridia bacterium]|nr:TIGR03960 family B12-binding radical SAM protein [Clostridia bacterium]